MKYQKSAEDYVQTGNFELAQGKFGEAEKNFKKALKINKNYEIAYCNLGNVYLKTHKLDKAIKTYKKALKIKPNYLLAHNNIGMAYSEQGNLKKALTHFQEAIEIDESYALAYVNIGNVILAQGNLRDAILCYKIALKKDPNNSNALNNLGTAYARQLKYRKALGYYLKALKHSSYSSSTLTNIATAYSAEKNLEKSIEYYKKAYNLNPLDSLAAANLYHQLKVACDWERAKEIEPVLNELTNREMKLGIKTGEDPFINVVRDDNLKRNYKIAKLRSDYIKSLITHRKQFKFKKPAQKRKIRIGYLSGHFHDHATGHLIAGLFPKHDKEHFQTYVYSHGPDDKSSFRTKIKKTADVFTDIASFNFSDAAKLIYKNKIDILIDLDGFTDNGRLEIFALRPAPIQISYLGFPGTTGADFIDYIITDTIVTPPSFQKYFSEKFIYLPNSYQINDDTQTILAMKYRRSHFRLPKNAFIFCSFNGLYKIDPPTFDVWTKILKKVPNSVLWLLKGNNLVVENLKKEAKKRGVDPKRLIFSKMQLREKHIARIKLADLALDPFICNGHTTTSDSLWAGVPVITLQGKHFASRVASSILSAAGLPELITKTKQEYEKLAVDLANHPKRLSSIKSKLRENKKTKPLFNTKTFVKDLEKAYHLVWKRYLKGQKPDQIVV